MRHLSSLSTFDLRGHSAYLQAHEAETVQHTLREWLDKEEILTVPEWLDPADYSDPSEERTVTTVPYVCHIDAATARHSILESYREVVSFGAQPQQKLR